MMTIQEIYEKFDKIGCLTFATIEDGVPQTRIAHLRAYDDEGIYFQTMDTKPFYAQLMRMGNLSVCGMFPKTTVGHDEKGAPYFPPGYTIRITGEVREVPLEALKKKAARNSMFSFSVQDIENYPAMTTFCLHKASGEVFDYDFEMEHRDHKLLRTGFAFGGAEIPFRGVRITEACIACGACKEACTFKAIQEQDGKFSIDHSKCDVCGDCYQVCPANAIEVVKE